MHAATETYGTPRHAVAYEMTPTHPVLIGYLYWILGIFGAHRFYFGRPITGVLWFFTGGVFLIGWIVDLFLIPSMAEDASRRYRRGRIDYTLCWVLHTFLGLFGVHRLYMGKIFTGVLYLLTGGLLGVGFVYDLLTLNEQIDELNAWE
ncbi:TM2 domain-containing protein [Stieleria sp. ICT_E10.1]|nr:TM2 domain-containing protein [Stieleria sedimenti]MCS7468555.1 TM2 domain-containing protein [Stieleria sedimenti]